MSGPSGGWRSNATGALFMVLLTAVVAYLAWQLLKRVLPAVIVVVVLIGVYRLAVGSFRGDSW